MITNTKSIELVPSGVNDPSWAASWNSRLRLRLRLDSAWVNDPSIFASPSRAFARARNLGSTLAFGSSHTEPSWAAQFFLSSYRRQLLHFLGHCLSCLKKTAGCLWSRFFLVGQSLSRRARGVDEPDCRVESTSLIAIPTYTITKIV